jgi:hypothetical protein
MRKLVFVCSLIVLASGLERIQAQGTSAFTYQGQMDLPSGPATGTYQMVFRLYDALSGGGLRAGPLTNSVVVSNGLFTTQLDFGANYGVTSLWLEIGVRTNGSAVAHTLLSPRQRLTPVPYAVYAMRAGDLQTGASPTFTGTVTFNPSSGPPFTVGNSTKVANLNADLLDGFDSTAFVLKAGDTLSGNLTIANPATLNFGSSVRQMINLWGSTYGLGVQAASLYFRSDDGFAWFRDGIHAVGTYDPGAGGTTLMTLNPNGNLTVNAGGGAAVTGDGGSFLGGVGVRGVTAGALSVGVFGWATNGAVNSGVYGRTDGTNSIGVSGLANFPSGLSYGVHGKSVSSGGVGVYGLNGGGGGSYVPAAVYGESTAPQGNGVVGVAHNGTAAYGVWGRSTDGWAGIFDGAVRITGDSSHEKPFLQLRETQDGDYARIQLQVASRPLWHISVGGVDNSLVFYNSANSIVTSVSETGVLTTKVLTITGGADIAEPFKMSEANLPKGAVVVIDEENASHLKLSTEAYDRRVAGVISGAGGVTPGLSLSQQGVIEGDQHVALTGRVYVNADAANGAIKPGDLLTSSATPGHAMKVADHARAQGAILGKAMTGLKEGKGLVLVLVTLQ